MELATAKGTVVASTGRILRNNHPVPMLKTRLTARIDTVFCLQTGKKDRIYSSI